MSESTKKCPMCAEQIPADSVLCPYCGTPCGEEIHAIPPPTAPIIAPLPSQATAPARKTSNGIWIAGTLVVVVSLGIIGTLLWKNRASLPMVSGLFATTTPTATHTLPPTITPTSTIIPTDTPFPTPRPTLPLPPTPAWMAEFAQPILDAVANRQPDFQDDFAQASNGWKFDGGEIKFADGVMVISVEKDGGSGQWDTPGTGSENFVLFVDADISGLRDEDTAEINWSKYYLLEIKHDGRWFASSWQDNYRHTLGSGQQMINNTKKVTIKLISNGRRYGIYMDDTPISSTEYSGKREGTKIGLRGWSGGTTTVIVRYDNVKVWNLDKIPNLP